MKPLDVNNIDPELLRQSTLQALHSATQSARHIASEYGAHTPDIMPTLKDDGPYAWMIAPQVLSDGGVSLPIATTREEVRQCYNATWAAVNMRKFEPMIDLRGAWYVFQEAMSTVHILAADVVVQGETVALTTVSNTRTAGITGELAWARTPREKLGGGAGVADPSLSQTMLRRQLFDQHGRYIDALRAGDLDGVLGVMHERVQAAVRDYVDDTGALISLDGSEAHRDYFRAFFDKYEICAVEPLDRVAQDWYLFAEVRMDVRERASGRDLSFHTAEIHVPAHDGRFIARIGHGVDPA